MGTEFESHSGTKESSPTKKQHLRVVSSEETQSPLHCPVCQSKDLKVEPLETGTLIRCLPNGHYSLVN